MGTLSDRCEAARGPDRTLDADIWDALGLSPTPKGDRLGEWQRGTDPYGKDGAYHMSDMSTWGQNVDAPKYTESLDAAMSLVPNDWHIVLSGCNDSWYICLTHTPKESRGARTSFTVTPALALCAAALRARDL